MQENQIAKVRSLSRSAMVFLLFAYLAISTARMAIAEEGDLMPKPRDGAADTTAPQVQEQPPDSAPEQPPAEEPKKIKTKIIDTSIEEKPAVTQAASEPEEKSEEYKAREAKLSEPLKKLLSAPHIYDFSKGGSSDVSEAFVLAAKAGAGAREDLLFIVENGSPAGKIYAACLIRMFDPATGTRILNDFKPVKTLVKNKSYVAQEHYTMGEVATDLLSSSPSIVLKSR